MYVGVDVGTSVTKAVGIELTSSPNGPEPRTLSTHAVPTRLDSPRPGWFEQDIPDVLAAVAQVVRRVVAECRATRPNDPVRLIGITGQGDGVWLLDTDGRPVRPAISWTDNRAAEVVRRWIADGIVEELFRRNGGVIFPGCPAPILAWLDAHEPRALDRAAVAGYCKDAVLAGLTGTLAADLSDASLPFLDPRTGGYDPGLIAQTGLEHRADLLAPIARPTPLGTLHADGAQLLDLPVGTPVTAGPFDLPAAARGSGLERVGDGHVIVGTTVACQVLTDRLDTTGEPSGLTISLPPQGSETPQGSGGGPSTPGRHWLRALPTMVGTAALDWLLALVGESHARLDTLLAASPRGARGVTCLPYFSASGERAPFVEPAARARLDGLTVGAIPADLVRATCEAIAYAARHCLESAGLAPEATVTLCGGGTRSAGWLELFAQVLGRTVQVPAMAEVGAYGAVLAGLDTLAAHGTEPAEFPPTASPLATRVPPDPAAAAEHEAGYQAYLAAVASARRDWSAAETDRTTPVETDRSTPVETGRDRAIGRERGRTP